MRRKKDRKPFEAEGLTVRRDRRRRYGAVRIGGSALEFSGEQTDGRFRVGLETPRAQDREIRKRIVKPEDTLVLTGDHSWGRKLSEAREDLAFIERLPGKKILLRGNHDMFWEAKKTNRLNEEFSEDFFFCRTITRRMESTRWSARRAIPLRGNRYGSVGQYHRLG